MVQHSRGRGLWGWDEILWSSGCGMSCRLSEEGGLRMCWRGCPEVKQGSNDFWGISQSGLLHSQIDKGTEMERRSHKAYPTQSKAHTHVGYLGWAK